MADVKVPALLHKMSKAAQKAWYKKNNMKMPSETDDGGKSAAAAKKVKVEPRKKVAAKPETIRALNAARQKGYYEKGGRSPVGAAGPGGQGAMVGVDQGSAKQIIKGIKAGVNPKVALVRYTNEKVVNEATKKEAEALLGGPVKAKPKMPPGKQPAGYRYVRGLARKAMKAGLKKEEVVRVDESHKVGDLVSYFHKGLGDHVYGEVQSVADDHITMKSAGKTWKVPLHLVHKANKNSVPKYRYEQVEQVDEGKIAKALAVGAMSLASMGAKAHTDTTKSVAQLAKERPALAQRLQDIGATGQVPASDKRAAELQKKQDQEMPASERRAKELEKMKKEEVVQTDEATKDWKKAFGSVAQKNLQKDIGKMRSKVSRLKYVGADPKVDMSQKVTAQKTQKGMYSEEAQYIEEKLTAADPASKWISDFVASDNPKFAGKSKKERINMALGAYYSATGKGKKNEEAVAIEKKLGEGMDAVGREDKDIDNDGDSDKTDVYLHNKRKAIGNAIRKKLTSKLEKKDGE